MGDRNGWWKRESRSSLQPTRLDDDDEVEEAEEEEEDFISGNN